MSKKTRKPKVGQWITAEFVDVGPRSGIYLGDEKMIEPFEREITLLNGAPITRVGDHFSYDKDAFSQYKEERMG